MIANSELEMIWEEVVIACFKILSQNVAGGTEENHRHLNSEQPVPRLRKIRY
jgi:hypothetical protein